MVIEKFDIEKFNEKNRTLTPVFDETEGRWRDILVHTGHSEETLSDGTIVIQTEENFTHGEKEYTESIIPPNSVFCIHKSYFPDGSLKTKFTKDNILGTVSFIPSGKEFYYDKKGVLIKEIDNETLYNGIKVTPEKLFLLLDRYNIYKLEERPKGVLYVWFNSSTSQRNEDAKFPYKSGDNPFWEITRIFIDGEIGSFNKAYKIDAVTEELIELN